MLIITYEQAILFHYDIPIPPWTSRRYWYAIYNSAYAIAVGVAAIGYMAFGKVKDYFDKLIK